MFLLMLLPHQYKLYPFEHQNSIVAGTSVETTPRIYLIVLQGLTNALFCNLVRLRRLHMIHFITVNAANCLAFKDVRLH